MANWFHAAVLALGIAATAAVGVASAAMLNNNMNPVGAKGDLLAAPIDDGRYQTVEMSRAGVSVLTRVQSD